MSPHGYNIVVSNDLETQPTVNPVLTVAGAYSANDYVGTSGVAMIFTGCAAQNGGGGWLVSAKVVDAAVQSVQGELWVFDTAITPPSDNAAWSISDADANHLIAVLPMNAADYFASALNSTCDGAPPNGPKRYLCAAGSKSLYACFVTRGAPTYTSLDLYFKLSVMQD